MGGRLPWVKSRLHPELSWKLSAIYFTGQYISFLSCKMDTIMASTGVYKALSRVLLHSKHSIKVSFYYFCCFVTCAMCPLEKHREYFPPTNVLFSPLKLFLHLIVVALLALLELYFGVAGDTQTWSVPGSCRYCSVQEKAKVPIINA